MYSDLKYPCEVGRERMRTEFTLWKVLAKRPLLESRIICDDNIKIGLKCVTTI